MSSDVPVQVVVAAFKDEKAASSALAELKQAKKEGLIKIVDAAVLSKDASGKLHIKETADMGGVEAARAIEPLCMLWCIPGFLRNEWTHAFRLLRK